MKRATLALLCGLVWSGHGVAPALAQTNNLTEDEIVDRFKKQKTRGLTIAPVTPQPEVAGVTPTTIQPENMQIMPNEEQVNINISFDFDSAALRADQKPKLTALCSAMQAVEGNFRILGHTDASGSEAYNQRLSKLRAEEVKRFLVADCSISPDRLEATGVGEQFLFDPNDPRGDVNRRVEFQVIS